MSVIMHIDKSPAIVMGRPARSSQLHVPRARLLSEALHFTTTITSPPIIPSAFQKHAEGTLIHKALARHTLWDTPHPSLLTQALTLILNKHLNNNKNVF